MTRRPLIAYFLIVLAVALPPLLAGCGGTSAGSDPIATAPNDPIVAPSSGWTAEALGQSIFDEYAKDSTPEITLTDVLCINVSGPTWECILKTTPDEYTVNLNVTADNETMTWVSRPLN